jgi:Xaa-Pro aminopeptidase
MKIGGALSNAHVDWLAQNMKAGATVAVDGMVMGLAAARAIESALQSVDAKLRTDLDLLDEIWPDRAALPAAAIYAHERAPVARASKLAGVRAAMKDTGAEWHFVSTLDDIAWLTNLRGADVTYNPVFLAHLLVGEHEAMLFVGAGKVPGALEAKLKADGFSLAPYADAAKHLARLTNTALLVDPKRITYGFRQKVHPSVKVIEAINPSTLAKSRKTAEEIEQIRRTMEHDGAALAEFLSWLEGALATKGERITEITVDERLTACRAGRPNFVCPSFSTIAGFNANGAMPHYRATPASHATIDGDGMLLIDSGGQYETGTTDITRVIPVGKPSAEMKRDYTLVLKGMIALSMAKFPRGTRSPLLDTIARAPIWAAGVDFGHGTGHGVGYFLNVHEGPHGITPHLPPEPHTAMEPGMITSNEPGIYRPGQWGVRIENLVLNVPAEETEFGEFLKFETLTLCPIDTRLIDRSLMRADEIAWLNGYHAEVRRRVGPLVAGAAKAWLQARTDPI